MEIVGLEAFHSPIVSSYREGSCWILVRLLTDEGLEGIGEWTAGAQPGREDSQIRRIENLGNGFVTGIDLFKIEGLGREYALMTAVTGIHIVLCHTLLQ